MAALDVRAIAPDELLDWVGVAHVAFHSNRPPADEAAFRREAFDQDFARTLAAVDGERIVGTLESFAAELTLPGGTCVTADAITAVSVLPTHHRRGALTRMISSDLRAARERGEVASILVPSEYPIYGRFGFGPATRRVEYSLNPAAARFTRAAAGQVDLVEPSRLLELAPPIFDRVRRQGPGQIDRKPVIWEMRLGLRETPWYQRDSLVRCATYTGTSGEIEGYLFYRSEEARQHHRPGNTIEIGELMALTTDAYLGLWRFCCEIDLVSEVKAPMRPPDEPLAWLIDNPRAALHETRRTDFLWLRPLDMPRFFGTRRYAVEERLVIEVADPQELCGGRFVLEGGPSGASCRATQEAADLQLGMTALGALSLGGQNVHVLAEGGLIDEARPGALDRAERLFHWPVTPWCSTMF